jgi:hypothetical protein
MRLLMRGQQTGWTDELRRHAGRMVHFALSRFSPSIGLVTVDLRDSLTAPDDLDRTCRIVAHLVPSGSVLVEKTQKDISSAIDQAAECAGHAVQRVLGRERGWDTGGPKL